jgi:hypothetical protein
MWCRPGRIASKVSPELDYGIGSSDPSPLPLLISYLEPSAFDCSSIVHPASCVAKQPLLVAFEA